MDHPHAAHLLLEGADEKLPQGQLRLGDRESVQVDLALRAELAAAQPAQQRARNLRALEHQLLAAGEQRVVVVGIQALLEHRGALGAREARTRTRGAWPRGRRAWRERPDAPHRLAEQPRFLVDLILPVVALPLTRRACHDSLRGIAS